MSVELLELRQSIVEERYGDALRLVDVLDEMSRKSIIFNIKSYLVRAFVHLIKMAAEKRLTRSWFCSIRDSLLKIQDLNMMENKRSYYLKPDDWTDYLAESYDDGIYEASLEVAGGIYDPATLAHLVKQSQITAVLAQMIADTYGYSRKELTQQVEQHLDVFLMECGNK